MASSFRDVDHGYAKLVKTVFGMGKPVIEVGILDGDGPHGDDAVSILMVGIWTEFGTSKAPARSFIRDWFDQNEDKLRADLVVLMQSVIAGKRTKEQVLELLGQRAVAQIQERMAAGVPPPNAPSTIKKKGSSTPTIDTGVLRSSVSYRVKDG